MAERLLHGRGRRQPAASAAQPARLTVLERGAGPAVVLLHGLASSARYWGDLLPLAGRHRVLAPDLLGFGRSPKPRDSGYTAAEHAAALHRTLHGRGAAPFALLGHSLGSLVALHYAATYPEDVRALLLISLPVVGACAWGHGQNGAMNPWHRFSVHTRPGVAIFGAGMRLAYPVWARVGPRLQRDTPPDAVRDALAGTWFSYWRSLEAVVYGMNAAELIERVPAPVTLIHGPKDSIAPVEPVRALAAAHPSLRLTEIVGAAHNPYYTHKDATLAAIAQAVGPHTLAR